MTKIFKGKGIKKKGRKEENNTTTPEKCNAKRGTRGLYRNVFHAALLPTADLAFCRNARE
jgi:hypothetical protein